MAITTTSAEVPRTLKDANILLKDAEGKKLAIPLDPGNFTWDVPNNDDVVVKNRGVLDADTVIRMGEDQPATWSFDFNLTDLTSAVLQLVLDVLNQSGIVLDGGTITDERVGTGDGVTAVQALFVNFPLLPPTSTGTVDWTSGGVAKAQAWDATVDPGTFTGDGTPASSTINRVTGVFSIDMTTDLPDSGTAITITYDCNPWCSTMKGDKFTFDVEYQVNGVGLGTGGTNEALDFLRCTATYTGTEGFPTLMTVSGTSYNSLPDPITATSFNDF